MSGNVVLVVVVRIVEYSSGYTSETRNITLVTPLACYFSGFGCCPAGFRTLLTPISSSETPVMAVVVQALVNAVSGGVLFTLNPLSGAHSEVVIESCWGLGEGVVSGEVTSCFSFLNLFLN